MVIGSPHQLVEVNGKTGLKGNYEALEKILSRADVRDERLMVISVAGAYRKGKSFLLSFFLRYLSASESARADGSWIGGGGGGKDERLKGFNWANGATRVTDGMWVWSEPFFLRDAQGNKVVVLLMDTQGVFDCATSAKDNATIFALSTLLSSCLIYNISGALQTDHLQQLHFFVEYGKAVGNKAKNCRRSVFLIRDWPFPEDFPYGEQGGAKYWSDERTKLSESCEELKVLVENVQKCFQKVDFFLSPHPGKKVATTKSFRGEIKEIDEDFLDILKEFCRFIFSPEHVSLIAIKGNSIRALEFVSIFTVFSGAFKNGKVPNVHSLVESNAVASHCAAFNAALLSYKREIDEYVQSHPKYSTEEIELVWISANQRALSVYEDYPKYGEEDITVIGPEVFQNGLAGKMRESKSELLKKARKSWTQRVKDYWNGLSREDLMTFANNTAAASLMVVAILAAKDKI